MARKILFIDRDGTIIVEPADKQVDSLEKLAFFPGVIPALLELRRAGFELVMVSNQDGLGTPSFPMQQFNLVQEKLLAILTSQGVHFSAVHICPHQTADHCDCRKPKIGLLIDYLKNNQLDFANSYVIGDRDTDLQLAANLGVTGIKIASSDYPDWQTITRALLTKPRIATVTRVTNETKITAAVNLDDASAIQVSTGIGFFDHMLEQLAKHGNFGLRLQCQGDLRIDDHHTVEDVAIVLGQALKQALADKRGIARYGFVLPMDESLAQVAIDLSGRGYLVFSANFKREKVGELATELVPHFFRSLADSLAAAINISVTGENTHHQIEAMFKACGRVLRQAMAKVEHDLPTTKGVL